VDQTAFYVENGAGKTIRKLTVMISEHRLVAVVAVHWTPSEDGGIFVWDWWSGDLVLVSVAKSLLQARGLVS